jgi:hypothetical protein
MGVEAMALVHEVEPASDEVPVVHWVHSLFPVVEVKYPGAQFVQAVDAPLPNLPAGHAVQPADVVEGTQYVPAPQHTVEPDVVHCPFVMGGLHPVPLHGTAEPLAAT